MAKTVRKPKVVQMYPTMDVLAAACAVYRINGNQIVKAYVNDDDGKSVSNPNSMMMKDHFAGVNLLNITDADREHAETVHSAITSTITLNVLSGIRTNAFFFDIAQRLERAELASFDFGIITYAPKLYADQCARQAKKDEYVANAYSNESLGAIGAKIAINFTMTSKRYIQQFNCFAANGHDGNGHAISFLTADEARCKSGNITGKIKSFKQDSYNNYVWTTSLNFVKVVE